jgi:hypothetical protein
MIGDPVDVENIKEDISKYRKLRTSYIAICRKQK